MITDARRDGFSDRADSAENLTVAFATACVKGSQKTGEVFLSARFCAPATQVTFATAAIV